MRRIQLNSVVSFQFKKTKEKKKINSQFFEIERKKYAKKTNNIDSLSHYRFRQTNQHGECG